MAVVLAMILDALLGEPKWLWSRAPHPAVVMGRAVGVLDHRLNDRTRLRGGIALAVLVLGAVGIGLALRTIPGFWVEVLVGAMLLAQKSLVDHVAAVARALRESVEDGRREVAKIVGRDVAGMDRPSVARAAIESGAENLSDGVIAPLMWFAIAGLPGLLVYKVVNTADSMIGYRSENYENFGWASAKFDDLLNWVPARVTAGLIWAVAPASARPDWGAIRNDAGLHRSPNAGWPEAAMAPTIGVSLSGPRSYEGTMTDFPWVHEAGHKDADPDHIDAAVTVMWKAWGLALAIASAAAIVQLV